MIATLKFNEEREIMSSAVTAVVAQVVLATAAVGGASYAIASGVDSSRKQQHAKEDAEFAANQTAKLQDEATNRVNQRRSNVGAILAAAQQASKGGLSGTMLTGPMGVDPSTLTLGKNSLLGD
jgi:hypothetical protein